MYAYIVSSDSYGVKQLLFESCQTGMTIYDFLAEPSIELDYKAVN